VFEKSKNVGKKVVKEGEVSSTCGHVWHSYRLLFVLSCLVMLSLSSHVISACILEIDQGWPK
jgi:hypothetical protein